MPTRAVVLIGIIVAVFFLYLQTPWETDYLAGGIRIIESEIAALPLPPDASTGTPLVRPEGPSVSVEYVTYTRTCDAIEAYYEQPA
jgi:hypothetical protein